MIHNDRILLIVYLATAKTVGKYSHFVVVTSRWENY